MHYITPIVPCINMEENNDIFIKRDDLLPFSFGGNKARIALEFFSDMEEKGKNCIVGYGNARSNLCRVLANMSYAKMGEGHCHIISPADDDGSRLDTSNSLIVKGCDAVFHTCTKQNVAETVDAVMQECENAGMRPYYIYGDATGYGNEAVPVRAYAKTYYEICNQFDYVFLATGTGMTQAGLIAGKAKSAGKEIIIGISVARNADVEENVIRKYLDAYLASIGADTPSDLDVLITDEYLCGGYGKYTPEVLDVIRSMMVNNGIALDPTYTGKAFYGMLEYLKKNNIKEKRVLFIHTGGTPLFFDNEQVVFRNQFSYHQLQEFIDKIDAQLPTPLSNRIDLDAYTEKLYTKAHICAEKVDGCIVSLVAGYTKNMADNMSYITLVGTLASARRRGYAEKLMKEYISYCRSRKIRGIHLHTEHKNTAAIALYTMLGFESYKIENEPRPDDCHLVYWL